MKHNFENGVLTIYLEGDVNSYNSEEVGFEIEDIIKKYNFNSLVLDLEKLNYISSAGIRILIKIKKEHNDTKLVKVSKSVYEIFEMVGLHIILKIEKL